MPTLRRPGFTLIELIVVISIIAVLSAVVFVSIDIPKRQHQAHNARRWTDVTTILQAIKNYQLDKGNLPANFPAQSDTKATLLGTSVTCSCAGLPSGVTLADTCGVDLTTALAPYIKSVPFDPNKTSDADTRYWVMDTTNGVIQVGACDSEGEAAGGGSNSSTPIPVISVSG